MEKLPCGRQRPVVHSHRQTTIADWRPRLEAFLTENGLRKSDQRFQIVETILAIGGHFNAQEMIDAVRKENPEIGPATVYRNLKVLCDAGFLTETLTDQDGRTFYEISTDDHHDHIVCVDCGSIFEFHDAKIEALQNQLCQSEGFKVTAHRHVVYGKCTRF